MSPLPCQPGHLPAKQHFGCSPRLACGEQSTAAASCDGFSHPCLSGWGRNRCPLPGHKPFQAVPAPAPIPGAPGLLIQVCSQSGALPAAFTCPESLKRPKFGVFSFPTQMIHCTFLYKQWVDPRWISRTDTAPIPGLGSYSSAPPSLRPPNLSCSKAQVQEQTCVPRTCAECLWGAEGKESPSVPQAMLLDAGKLPCIVHPSLPCTPDCCAPLAAMHPSLPTQPLEAPFPTPAGEQPTQHHSRLIASASCCLRKA